MDLLKYYLEYEACSGSLEVRSVSLLVAMPSVVPVAGEPPVGRLGHGFCEMRPPMARTGARPCLEVI
jgi:hypothetical protein